MVLNGFSFILNFCFVGLMKVLNVFVFDLLTIVVEFAVTLSTDFEIDSFLLRSRSLDVELSDVTVTSGIISHLVKSIMINIIKK